jgi:protein-S-isoprenylcysteine O-methyltransferase Ste14
MLLEDHFRESGNFLFKWRSFVPALFLVLTLIEIRDYSYIFNDMELNRYWEFFALTIGMFGLLIRVLTIGFTPRRTSGRNTKEQIADILNTTGIYSTVRNPLYVGNYFMMLGVILYFHNLNFTLLFTLFFWLYYERIIYAEESFLKGKFGQHYIDWAEKTPVFVPNLKLYRRADLEFSFKNVLKREYNGFFAVILALFIFKIVGDYTVNSEFIVDTVWLSIFGVGAVVWLTLRSLKKYTKVLNVSGR